jgi:hypothetical protein
MSYQLTPGDGEAATVILLGGSTKGTRLALTTSSAPLTAGRLTVGVRYKLTLTPDSSGAAWIDLTGGTAVAPASDAAETAGFWLQPGEVEIIEATANRLSGIMLAGTGTLLITRFKS